MFTQSLRFTAAFVVATAILLLASEPSAAQHRGGVHHGGSIHHGYSGHGGYSHFGYYPGHYSYYPSHYNYYRHTYPSYSHFGLGYNPGYYSYPGYVPGYSLYSPPSSSYRAYYPPSLQPQIDNTAHISVRVPADAEVWFEGAATTQKGSLREFVSPPLTSGYQYTYTIRARWMEGNREVVQTRSVSVEPGTRASIDFTAPAPTEKVPAPKKSMP